jgi:large subunit ribosomal protein L34
VEQMKQTFQPNNKKAKKDHGFFARKEGKGNILSARRNKGRKILSK